MNIFNKSIKYLKSIVILICTMAILTTSSSSIGIDFSEKNTKLSNFYTYMGNNKRSAFAENIDIGLPIENKWRREIGLDLELLPYYPWFQWPIMSKEFLYVVIGRGILRINKSSGIYSYTELDYSSSYPLATSLAYSQNKSLLFVPYYCFDCTEERIDLLYEKYITEKRKIFGYRPYDVGIPVVIDNGFLVWHDSTEKKTELVKVYISENKTETIYTLDSNESPQFLTLQDSNDKIVITSALMGTSKSRKTYVSKYIFRCIDLKSNKLLWSQEIDNEEGYAYFPPGNPFISGNKLIIGLRRAFGGSKLEIIGIDILSGEISWKKEFKNHEVTGVPYLSSCATDETLYISGTFGDSNKIFFIDTETGEIKMEIPVSSDSFSQITGSKNYLICTSSNPAKLSFINRTTGEIEFEYSFDDDFNLASPVIFDNDGLYIFLLSKTNKLFVEKLGSAKF